MKVMLRLKQVQRDWFNIVDDSGSMVGATLEDLHSFNDEIVKQTGMFSSPKKKTETTMVILENNCNCEKVQLELSNSALRLLWYLSENDWFDEDICITEIDETEFERFV